MVISASRRTDIPAFYSDWFMNRLEEGYCYVRNPVSGVPFRVSLHRCDIDGIVFWTKNLEPIMPHLGRLKQMDIPFYFHFTITPYDQLIERSVIPCEKAVELAKQLADRFGPKVVVWRYDPILISEHTLLEWHIERFAFLAGALRGSTDEVATSFVVPYAKTKRNLFGALKDSWTDPPVAVKQALLCRLNQIALENGMTLRVCCQPEVAGDLPHGACMNAERLRSLGAKLDRVKKFPNRPGCNCIDSRDIGEYDTCPHGCLYCYANSSLALATERFRIHDPNDKALLALVTTPTEPPKQHEMQF